MGRSWAAVVVCLALAGCGVSRSTESGLGGAPDGHGAGPRPPLGAVVYVREGDLWVQVLPSGTPRRLTTDGRNRDPVWSPSGDWVLFYKGGEVWLARRDGTGMQPFLPGRGVAAAAWAPDRDELAYRDGQGRLGVAKPDGTGDRLVAVPGSGEAFDAPAWSPDGQWLAFVRVQGERPQHRAAIARVPAAGGPVQELGAAQEPGTCLRLLGWAPDRQSVLFAPVPHCSNSIAADGLPLMVQPVEGGPPRQVGGGVSFHLGSLVGSRASGLLAGVTGGDRQAWTAKRILVWDGKGQGVRLVSPGDLAAISPAWSPEGGRLAFVAMRDIGPVGGGEPARQGLMGRRLWVVGADGKDPQPLTTDPAFREEAPRWTADGDHVLFVRYDASGAASLWQVGVRDHQPVRVADLGKAPGSGQEPTWWFGFYGWVRASALYDYSPRGSEP